MRNFTDILEARVAQSAETQRLRQVKNKALSRLNAAKKKGLDTTQLEKDLEQAWADYNASKAADVAAASGGAAPTTPKSKSTGHSNSTASSAKSQPAPNTPDPNVDYTKEPDYKSGYEEAIKAAKKMIEDAKNGQSPDDSRGDGDGEGAPMAQSAIDQAQKEANKAQKQARQQKQQQQSQSTRDANGSGSGSGSGGKQGKVRPEDCQPLGGNGGSMGDTPGTPGGMCDVSDGDKLAEAEGYEKGPGSEEGIKQDWEKRAMDAAKAMQASTGNGSKNRGSGNGGMTFADKIFKMARPTTNWKQTLRKVVGRCLSEEDKRQAYANKNVLVAQDRIARTDKDKYDSLSTIIAFIDTSGSMSDTYRMECLQEVWHVANAKKPSSILIVPFDDGPTDFIKITNIKKMEQDIKKGNIPLKGGGGTSLKGCWDLFKSDKRFKGQCFELVMVFTDGYLDQPKRLPRSMQNLVWVIDENPSWQIKNKDAHTFRIDLGSKKNKLDF